MNQPEEYAVVCRECQKVIAIVYTDEQAKRVQRLHVETWHIAPRPTQKGARA